MKRTTIQYNSQNRMLRTVMPTRTKSVRVLARACGPWILGSDAKRNPTTAIIRCTRIFFAMKHIFHAMIESTHSPLDREPLSIEGMDLLNAGRHRRFDSSDSIATWTSDVSLLGVENSLWEAKHDGVEVSDLESNMPSTTCDSMSTQSCDLDNTVPLIPLRPPPSGGDYRPSMWDVVRTSYREGHVFDTVADHMLNPVPRHDAADMRTRQEQL